MKKTTEKDTASNNLADWLSNPGSDAYFGRRFCFKFAVLAYLVSGEGTLAEIGRKFGASKQAAFHHAKKARHIFGLVKQ